MSANLPQDSYKDILTAGQSIAQIIEDKDYRVKSLIDLSSKFPEAYEATLADAQSIKDEDYYVKFLMTLAAKFPESHEKLLVVVPKTRDIYDYAQILNNLLLEQVNIYEFEQEITIKKQNLRLSTQLLSCVQFQFPWKLFELTLAAAQSIKDERLRTEALRTLSINLPKEFYKEFLTTVQSIEDEEQRSSILKILAANLPQEFYETVLTMTKSIKKRGYRFTVLIALAVKFPKLYEIALTEVKSFTDSSDRADALFMMISLAINLPHDLYKELLHAVQSIEYEKERVQVLLALTVNIPQELYISFLAVAQSIQDEKYRAYVFSNLISKSSNLFTTQQFAIWQETLFQGSQRKRPEFLSDLAALVPLIDNLGGKAASIGVAKSIQQVAKWWR